MVTRTDFDTPRADNLGEPDVDSLELLKEQRHAKASDPGDTDDDTYQLPGFELIDDDLTEPVVPVGSDEFRCAGCFLVYHRARIAGGGKGRTMCQDCV